MKDNLKALYALYFFRPYTTWSRQMEILLGVFAWTQIIIFIIGVCKIFYKYIL